MNGVALFVASRVTSYNRLIALVGRAIIGYASDEVDGALRTTMNAMTAPGGGLGLGRSLGESEGGHGLLGFVRRDAVADRVAVSSRTVDADRYPPHSPRGVDASPHRRPVTQLVAQLSEGQRECLRLVYRHMTSKDIARELGISPHTVDMRLRTAMKTLGVDGRIDAARLLFEAEGEIGGYQPLIYQSPELGGAAKAAMDGAPASTVSDDNAVQHSDTRFSPGFDPPAGGPPRPAGASLPFNGAQGAVTGQRGGRVYQNPLAGSLPWGERNDLPRGLRLVWIVAIAMGSALSFGAILGALEALKQLL